MNRPYCVLSSAISVDGKIATARSRNSALSSLEDWKRVHRLRNSVDAIMVGKETVMIDDPKLVVKKELLLSGEELKQPIRVAVDSTAQISPKAAILTFTPEITTIIAVSQDVHPRRISALKTNGAEIVVCGNNKVDLRQLMDLLYERGVRKLMLEGGGNLNWSMFSLGLVDELRLAVAPTVIGGSRAISLFEGVGFDRTNESPVLNLKSKEMFGDCLVLTYIVKHDQHRERTS